MNSGKTPHIYVNQFFHPYFGFYFNLTSIKLEKKEGDYNYIIDLHFCCASTMNILDRTHSFHSYSSLKMGFMTCVPRTEPCLTEELSGLYSDSYLR